MKDRGYYFDFVEFQKNAEGHMTPSTPSIGHVYALASKLDDFFTEGLDARYARHAELAQMTHAWAARHGFTLFPEKGFESVTLTCVNNGAKPGGRTVDVAKLQKLVKDQGFLIDGGYGKIKGTTFRLSNMGDETEATMTELYTALDNAMKQFISHRKSTLASGGSKPPLFFYVGLRFHIIPVPRAGSSVIFGRCKHPPVIALSNSPMARTAFIRWPIGRHSIPSSVRWRRRRHCT